ncbi:MAG: hypothetical protein K8H90_08465 [Thermoanaerobaculia bacterium]|nr:hypothetical protein [Thermoanaerobaculia bacterium]
MRRLRNLVALAALLGSSPDMAFGCSCGEQTLDEAFARAQFVFVGKVVRLEVVATLDGVDSIRASVAPSEVFKGAVGSSVEFATDNGCCYCSYDFEIAQEYLLFATEREGLFSTSACSRSELVDASQADLRALRAAAEAP